MISAEKAREITAAAQAEKDAYDRACITREAEDVCEDIRRAAVACENHCSISTKGLSYPNGVAEYLREELGYDAKYCSQANCINVSW